MTIAPASIRPARRSSRVGLLVALTFILAATAPISFGLTYDPLRGGSAFGVLATDGDGGELTSVPPGEPLGYRDGSQAGFFMSIRNTGLVGLTVTELPNDAETFGLFEAQDVLLVPAGDAAVTDLYGDAEPFEPFRLAVGEERIVVVRGRFAHCGYFPAGTESELRTAHVRFRVFGVTKSTTIMLPTPVRVTSPSDQDCPLPRA